MAETANPTLENQAPVQKDPAKLKWYQMRIPKKIYGINTPIFLIIAVLVLVLTYAEQLPSGLLGQVPMILAIMGIMMTLGETLPIIRDCGGRMLFPMFGILGLKAAGLIPDYIIEVAGDFKKIGWQNFYVAAIIAGSILSMNRKILVKSMVKFVPTLIVGQFAMLFGLWLCSFITKYNPFEAMFYLGAPCMCGGSIAALTTLPEMYSSVLGTDLSAMSGTLLATAQLGSWSGLLFTIVLKVLATKFPKLLDNGQGEILVAKDEELMRILSEQLEMPKSSANYAQLGAGLMIATVTYALGAALEAYVGILVTLAWQIVLCIIIKVAGLFPEELNMSANFWYRNMLGQGFPLLIGMLTLTTMDLEAMIALISFDTIVVIWGGIVFGLLGCALMCKLLGLHRYEGTLTAGLCAYNIGGSGDLQMCTIADRMELLPFASISTRLGGGLMVIWVSLLFPIFAKLYGAL